MGLALDVYKTNNNLHTSEDSIDWVLIEVYKSLAIPSSASYCFAV